MEACGQCQTVKPLTSRRYDGVWALKAYVAAGSHLLFRANLFLGDRSTKALKQTPTLYKSHTHTHTPARVWHRPPPPGPTAPESPISAKGIACCNCGWPSSSRMMAVRRLWCQSSCSSPKFLPRESNARIPLAFSSTTKAIDVEVSIAPTTNPPRKVAEPHYCSGRFARSLGSVSLETRSILLKHVNTRTRSQRKTERWPLMSKESQVAVDSPKQRSLISNSGLQDATWEKSKPAVGRAM